jgi:hypothetical protein
MKKAPAAYRSTVRLTLGIGLVLLLPLAAMQVTDEVAWSPADFAVAGALLAGTGLTYGLAARKAASTTYRAAVGVALAAALLLVWLNLAVGIIGTENDPANLMYVAVLAVGIAGALVARFRPGGMALALAATALAQAAVAALALLLGLGAPYSPPAEILGVNGIFVALFGGSAWLFRRAARERTPTAAATLPGRFRY